GNSGDSVEKLLAHGMLQIAENEVVRLSDPDLIARLAEIAFPSVRDAKHRGRSAARPVSVFPRQAMSATSRPKIQSARPRSKPSRATHSDHLYSRQAPTLRSAADDLYAGHLR